MFRIFEDQRRALEHREHNVYAMQKAVTDLRTGGDLDYWVARAERRRVVMHPSGTAGWWTVYRAIPQEGWDVICPDPDPLDRGDWSPSTKWEHGGPILEARRQAITRYLAARGETLSWLQSATLADWMRTYVAAAFGDTVGEPVA